MKRTFAIGLVVLLILSGLACDGGRRSGPVADSPGDDDREALYLTEGPTSPVEVGKEQAVTLQIRPATGWKINKLFDWKLDFESNPAAGIGAVTVGSDDIVLADAGASIPVTLKAAAEGPIELAASADFSVCTEEKCELYQDVPLTFVVPATRPDP